MNKIKIISVSSLAAHRTASIKAQVAIMGSSVLPVPTIVLNGVASFAQLKKQELDFMPLLEGTLELCIEQEQTPYLFVGYLTSPESIFSLKYFIEENKHKIAGVFVDPISGDNGKPYIHADIIKGWPQLLSLANFAFPNITELKMHSGISSDADLESHIKAFEIRFPSLDYVLTSYSKNNKFGVRLKTGNETAFFSHAYVNARFDGTGDVFASFLLKHHIIEHQNYNRACKKALKETLRLITKAYKTNSTELEIN